MLFRFKRSEEAFEAKVQEECVKQSNESVFTSHNYSSEAAFTWLPVLHGVAPVSQSSNIIFTPEHPAINNIRKKLLGVVNSTLQQQES